MEISVTEKKRWVSDLICRELRRFEEDTGVCVQNVCVRKLGDRVTSVNLEVIGRNAHEPG